MAHERLAIVDVTHGAQPLYNETRDIVLAVNGEIYNHRELRKTLKSPSKFMTDSDCEIILHLYEEGGMENVSNKLNGIFGFVLYDEKKVSTLVCPRVFPLLLASFSTPHSSRLAHRRPDVAFTKKHPRGRIHPS